MPQITTKLALLAILMVLGILQSRLAYSSGKCNGSMLIIQFRYPDAEMKLTSIDYENGYLTKECDDSGNSPPQWLGIGHLFRSNQVLTLYAHEDNGKSKGKLGFLINGKKGNQVMTLEYDYKNMGSSCNIKPVTVSSSSNKYQQSCAYSQGTGDCSPSSSFTYTVEPGASGEYGCN